MRGFLIRLFVSCLALLVVLYTVPGVSTNSWVTTLVAVLVISLINAFLRPVIIILTLPINILTLGIFTLFINGFIFLVVSKFVQGFNVDGFWGAFWAALIFSIVSALLNIMTKDDE
ncbi:MAG: phage holin family protein [Armatimonadota bacterium]